VFYNKQAVFKVFALAQSYNNIFYLNFFFVKVFFFFVCIVFLIIIVP